jgi:hypothetical protein
VVKVDGLAAGKGVVVARTVDEAFEAVDDMLLARKFGSAGGQIVVEEFLEGEEASFFALVDGETALPLVSAQDHKPVGELHGIPRVPLFHQHEIVNSFRLLAFLFFSSFFLYLMRRMRPLQSTCHNLPK